MAPRKMEGFGSSDFKQPGESSRGSDIHNKPPPKGLWHAASRFASTAFDVAKPASANKEGYNGSDIGKTAGDVWWTFNGYCKHTGTLMSVEHRMGCSCAGCQSWDNEKCLKSQQEEKENEDRERTDRQQRNAEEEAQKGEDGKRRAAVGYVAPSLMIPTNAPTPQRNGPTNAPTPQRNGPWGPVREERQEKRSEERQEGRSEEQAAPFAFVRTDPAHSADLLGDVEVAAPTTDLLSGAFDGEQAFKESRDLTDLLSTHACVKEDETDLIGLGGTDAADKKPEQFDPLF